MLEHKGYKSRKLHMAYVVMALGTIGYGMTGIWPALVAVYPQFGVFLLGAASIYAGSNAAVKWLAVKNSPETAKAPVKEPKLESPPNPNAD